MKPQQQTREDWLVRAAEAVRMIAKDRGYTIPTNVRVSCGWPKSRGKSTIGQCWPTAASKDGMFEVFISPTVDDQGKVLATLVHELGHAAVGLHHGHRAPFAAFCMAMCLQKPWTSTTAASTFERVVQDPVEAAVGFDYPHRTLTAEAIAASKQTTRLLKCHCLACGYTVRITMKWALLAVPDCPNPDCPKLAYPMKVDIQ